MDLALSRSWEGIAYSWKSSRRIMGSMCLQGMAYRRKGLYRTVQDCMLSLRIAEPKKLHNKRNACKNWCLTPHDNTNYIYAL